MQNPKQTRGRGKPKGKLQDQRQNPPKAQAVEESYNYENPNKYYHNTSNQSQGHRPYNGQSENRQFRGFAPKIEDKDLNIVNVSFRTTAIREVHRNKIVHNMVVHDNCIFKGIK